MTTVGALGVAATAEGDQTDRVLAAADSAAGGQSAAIAADQGSYVRESVTTGAADLTYVRYSRRYGTIPVLGADLVVVVGADGGVRHTNVANEQPFRLRSIQPGLTADQARARMPGVSDVPRLAVLLQGAARLVWSGGPSAAVDAFTGDTVLDAGTRTPEVGVDRLTRGGVDPATAEAVWRASTPRRTSAGETDARLTTLQAAGDLYPDCGVFDRVRAAWDAAGTPVAAGEPSCGAFPVSAVGGLSVAGDFATHAPTAVVEAGRGLRIPVAGLTGGGVSVTGAPHGSRTRVDNGALVIDTAADTPAATYTVTLAAYGARTRTVAAAFRVDNPRAERPTVNIDNVRAHLAEFGAIATAHDGNRMTSKAGHTKSLEYVEAKLKAAGYTTQRVECKTCSLKPTWNLIADYPGGDESNTYMFGAHLDGVQAGAGINDNGSGSSGILEAALQVAQAKPEIKNHLRFAWWAGEEQGLLGSTDWVRQLPPAEKSKIKAYMNFDMIGSPNAAYFINNIDTDLGKAFKGYFDEINVQTEENLEGKNRSDDASFTRAGIPASGAATGASYRMTAAQAQKWGGKANTAYDVCYHKACDTPTNINATALDRMSNSIMFAIWTLNVGQQG